MKLIILIHVIDLGMCLGLKLILSNLAEYFESWETFPKVNYIIQQKGVVCVTQYKVFSY